jgi:hypothetical protein
MKENIVSTIAYIKEQMDAGKYTTTIDYFSDDNGRRKLNGFLIELGLGCFITSKKDGTKIVKWNNKIISSTQESEICRILADFIKDVEDPHIPKFAINAEEDKTSGNETPTGENPTDENANATTNEDSGATVDGDFIDGDYTEIPERPVKRVDPKIKNDEKLSQKKYANERILSGDESLLVKYLNPTDFTELVAAGEEFRLRKNKRVLLITVGVILGVSAGTVAALIIGGSKKKDKCNKGCDRIEDKSDTNSDDTIDTDVSVDDPDVVVDVDATDVDVDDSTVDIPDAVIIIDESDAALNLL